MATTAWEKRVEPASTALGTLGDQISRDLDEDTGGVGWWAGQLDWRRIVLLSDYLIQSVEGAATSLSRASYAADEHRSVQQAIDYDAVKKLRAQQMPYEGRSPHERKQDLRREMTIEQVLYYLCQCLDRLAAAVLIVGAINTKDVAKADWSRIDQVLDEAQASNVSATTLRAATRMRLMPAGSPGRGLQDSLLAPAAAAGTYGPHDWLTWLRETRNAATHRAQVARMLLLKGRPGRPEGLHRGLPRVPKLSTVETFVHAPSSGRSLDKVVLAKGTPETLEGFVGSTADLAHALAASMTACWTGWRADPSALVVPFAQWRTIDPPAPQRFEGYGPDLKLLVGKGGRGTRGAGPRSAHAGRVHLGGP